MNSASPEPSELVNRLRQQLILAQVRIMELEDTRDGLAPRLTELERLLAEAQTLADRKLDEAAHLEIVLADSQADNAQLRQVLESTGRELAATHEARARAEMQLALDRETLARLETELVRSREATADGLRRRGELEAELQHLRSTRSWRWTAWLRALGRKLGG